MGDGFENYLSVSEEDSFYSSRGGKGRYDSFQSAEDQYDFDVKKTKKKKGSSTKRKKEQEKLDRARRQNELSKTKEERMEALLGNINTQRQRDKIAEDERQRLMEQEVEIEQRKQQETTDQVVSPAGSSDMSFGSESFELSSTDFEAGAYKNKSEKLDVTLQSVPMHHDSDDDEPSTKNILQRRLSEQLNEGVAVDEVAKQFTFQDLSGLMNAPDYDSEEHTNDEEESNELVKDIYASIEADASEDYLDDFYSTAQTAKSPNIEDALGARVKAKLPGWGEFYSGVIEKVDSNEEFTILFDDGEICTGVNKSLVEFLPQDHQLEVSTKYRDEEQSYDMSYEERSLSHDISTHDNLVEQSHEKSEDNPVEQSHERSDSVSEAAPSPPRNPPHFQDVDNQSTPREENVDHQSTTPGENDPTHEDSVTTQEAVKRIFWSGIQPPSAGSTNDDNIPPPPPPLSPQQYSLSKNDRLIEKSVKPLKALPPPIHVKSIHIKKQLPVEENKKMKLFASSLEAELEAITKEYHKAVDRIQELETQHDSQEAEIFQLQASLSDISSTNAVRASLQRVISSDTNAVPKEELLRIEKEMAEQDRLLAGYQKENEKLVLQLRQAEEKSIHMRDTMYKASLRAGLEEQHFPVQADELQRKLRTEQELESLRNELSFMREDNIKKVTKYRDQVRDLTLENESLSKKLAASHFATPTSENTNLMESLRTELAQARLEHLEEAKRLKEKLVWYAENQQLIMANEDVISNLKEEIVSLKSGKPQSHHDKENRRSSVADIKRIRQLEKQVTELEEALRKRNPDCIANLILAAGPNESEKETRRELRQKVSGLEEELKNQEKTFNGRFRTLRQEHERIKLRYELLVEQDNNNNSKMKPEMFQGPIKTTDKEARIVALETEIVRIRDFYRKKIEDLSKKSMRKGVVGPVSIGQRDNDKLRATNIALESRVEELQSQLDTFYGKGVKISPCDLEEDNRALRKQLQKIRIEEKREVETKSREAPEMQNEQESEEKSLRKKLMASIKQNEALADAIKIMKSQSNYSNEEHWTRALERSEEMVHRLHSVNSELEAQLREAKKQLGVPTTPSMLQHQTLYRRLEDMELKFSSRERELQVIVQQVQHRSEMDLASAEKKFQVMLQTKNEEIQGFRKELNELMAAVEHDSKNHF